MVVIYLVNSLLVRQCTLISVCPVGSFELDKKFPLDKTDRDVRLMYSHCVDYMLHKPIVRAPTVRGNGILSPDNKILHVLSFFPA